MKKYIIIICAALVCVITAICIIHIVDVKNYNERLKIGEDDESGFFMIITI